MVDRVVQILAAHVFPLMSRTRRRVLRSIAERLVELDPEAGRAADPPHLIALALHTMTAVRRQEDELARLEHRFAELQDLVTRRPAEERRDLFADWLRA